MSTTLFLTDYHAAAAADGAGAMDLDYESGTVLAASVPALMVGRCKVYPRLTPG